MIISASRRTDIPNYYIDWFFERIKEGYVLVRNPVYFKNVSKISLTPDVVDCIVFWTKNPYPMLGRLDELNKYSYYFQFTLNPYGKDIEPNVPSKGKEIIPVFQELSRKIGSERVIWRYDPIFLNSHYTVGYHIKYFKEIARRLKGYTNKCIISFIDTYRKTADNVKEFGLMAPDARAVHDIAASLSETASEYNMELCTCSEPVDLYDLHISHAKCIDGELIEKMTGFKLKTEKDKNQREWCGCAASVDIGSYDTCLNGCKYCYATRSRKMARQHYDSHDRSSPLLFGTVTDDDIIKDRKVMSCKVYRLSKGIMNPGHN